MADVCIESLAPSSVDYKFVRQFVGEGDRRRARAASPAAAAPLSRELTGWMSGGGAAKGLHYRLPQLNCSIFMERGEASWPYLLSTRGGEEPIGLGMSVNNSPRLQKVVISSHFIDYTVLNLFFCF